MRTYGKADIKLINRRSVYEYIYSRPKQTASRPEIARALCITEPTVLKITNYFLKRGILTEQGTVKNATAGRRADRLAFNPDVAYTVEAEYDGNLFKLAALNLNHQIVKTVAKRIAKPLPEVMQRVIPEEYAALRLGDQSVLGLGLALPAVVDPVHNRIAMRNPVINLGGCDDLSEHVRLLGTALGLPVYLENDVNAAALAEYQYGRPEGRSDLIYLMLGLGIGAGLILDGKLRRGKHYSTGEIGYIATQPGFVLEKERSGQFENKLCREYLLDRFGIDILDGAGKGDMEGMIHHIASQTALCIANFAAMLDVEEYVLGGYLPELLGKPLVEDIQAQCDGMCLNPVRVCMTDNKESVLRGMGVIVAEAVMMRFLAEENEE